MSFRECRRRWSSRYGVSIPVWMQTVVTVALVAGVLNAVSACSEASKGEAGREGSGELRFTSVSEKAGLGDFYHETGAEGKKLFPESMGSGCAFIDFDGDGWLDILAAGGGTWPDSKKKPVPPVSFYRNNGDGTFTNKTVEVGLGSIKTYSNGFAVSDYDNDGDQDFYLTTLYTNMLFRNDGGRFTEVAEQADVAGEINWGSSAIFFDADKDGWLDLYVGNYVYWTPETDLVCTLDGKNKDYCTPQTYTGTPGNFYHNNGDGTFTETTKEAGFWPVNGKTLGLVEIDYNRDNWPDLMITNDVTPNHLFKNRGDGTFVDIGASSGVSYDDAGRTRAGMGVDAGVVDTSGYDTIFIGHFSREMMGVFHYMGNDLFVDRAVDAGMGQSSLLTLTFGMILADLDLDTDLDVIAANGHVQPDVEKTMENVQYAQVAHVYVNDGYGHFKDEAAHVGTDVNKPIVSRGAAYGDYDRDGDIDILISENAGKLHLWRNDLNSSAYLRVHTEGVKSNRDGIGTRVQAYIGSRPMERRIRGGSSYLSASEHAATFGLGQAAQIDSLVLTWPSGLVERFGPVQRGQDVFIKEGTRTLVSVPGKGPIRPADATT